VNCSERRSSITPNGRHADTPILPPASFALCGLLLLIGRRADGLGSGFAAACGAAFLFFLGVFMRPNIAPFAAVMLGGAGLAALLPRRMASACGIMRRISAGHVDGAA
jgi:hypothetical protein